MEKDQLQKEIDNLKILYQKVNQASVEYSLDNYGQPVHKLLEEILSQIRKEYSTLNALLKNKE